MSPTLPHIYEYVHLKYTFNIPEVYFKYTLEVYFQYIWSVLKVYFTLVRVWPILTPFLCKMGPKRTVFWGFIIFFQNYWIAIKVININWMSLTYFIKTSKKTQSGCSLGAKFGPNCPMLWKNYRNWHCQ